MCDTVHDSLAVWAGLPVVFEILGTCCIQLADYAKAVAYVRVLGFLMKF